MTNIPSRNIKSFLSAAALALAIPLTAAAEPGRADDCGPARYGSHGMQARHGGDMGHHAMAGGMSPRHLRHLNLTEAQQDKVFEITHGQAPGRRNQGKALHKAESELRKLTAAPDYSESKAKALADEIGKLTFEMTLARSKAERQIYELLTPEQHTQLADMKPPHEARHHRGDGPPAKGGDQRMPTR